MTEHAEGPNQPDRFSTDGLTPEEDLELVNLLKKWQGGRLSTPVFTELARMIPQPIVEVVIFRDNSGILETLLIPRPEDDIVWPGMYHTPGAAIRGADYYREDQNVLNGPFERIQKQELGTEFVYSPRFVGRLHRLVERGPEVAEIYLAQLPRIPEQGKNIWYPVRELSQNPLFIQDQLPHVMMAIDHYLAPGQEW